nr:MAG: helix-turn-helix domain protein [Bacteriophage sp.]
MNACKRLKKVINWLIFKEVAENERALSELLGYTKSSFSQIVTGKVPMSEKFMKKICSLDENINFVWLQSGEGEMFISDNLNSEVSFSDDVWKVIKQQAESLSARDRQIDELMAMLKEQIQENKKISARMEENASSAAAV